MNRYGLLTLADQSHERARAEKEFSILIIPLQRCKIQRLRTQTHAGSKPRMKIYDSYSTHSIRIDIFSTLNEARGKSGLIILFSLPLEALCRHLGAVDCQTLPPASKPRPWRLKDLSGRTSSCQALTELIFVGAAQATHLRCQKSHPKRPAVGADEDAL